MATMAYPNFPDTLTLGLAGQEGFEPPTVRFGVCCSAVRATGLKSLIWSLCEHCAYDIENNIFLAPMNQQSFFLKLFAYSYARDIRHKLNE